MEEQQNKVVNKKSKNIEEDKKQENKEELISTHIFILPFKILNQGQNNREDLLLQQKDKWLVSEIDEATKKYFNKYAKEALFPNYGDEKNNDKIIEKNHREIKNGIYEINYKNKKYFRKK